MNNVYFIPDFKQNLISVLKLHEQFVYVSFDINSVTIYKNGMTICSGYVDNRIYFIKPIFNNLLQTEMFKVTEPSLKRRKISSHDNETYLWHLRLGHINLDRIERLIKDGPLRELKVGTLLVCESCLEGKMTKRAFSTKGERAKAPMEIILSDVCGPLNVKARGAMNILSLLLTIIQDMDMHI